jgi:hypothetical protein
LSLGEERERKNREIEWDNGKCEQGLQENRRTKRSEEHRERE